MDLWKKIKNLDMNIDRYLDILATAYYKSDNLSPEDRYIVLDEIEKATRLKTGDPKYAHYIRKRFTEYCHPPYKPSEEEVE